MSDEPQTQNQPDDEYQWHTGKKRPSGKEDAVESFRTRCSSMFADVDLLLPAHPAEVVRVVHLEPRGDHVFAVRREVVANRGPTA